MTCTVLGHVDRAKYDARIAELTKQRDALSAAAKEAERALSLVDDETAKGLYVDFWGMLADLRAAISTGEGK